VKKIAKNNLLLREFIMQRKR